MSNNLMPAWVTGIGKAAAGTADALPASIELIDGEQLQHCAVSLSEQRAMIMAGLLNKLCPAYGITTKDVLHEFLANVLQESLEFQHKVENMNYRAVTIVNTWPKRFYLMVPAAGKLDANKYARKPKELAIAVYGGRMGNRPGTEDGWNLRGGGFIGLTGYYVYEAFRKYKGFKTVEEAAEYVRGSDYGALDSALWFFCVLKDLMDEAERDEMIGIVKEINGGTIGLKDRLHYYELVKKYVV
jgi:putative chitinase